MKSNYCINNLLKFISVLQDNSIDIFSNTTSYNNLSLGSSVFCKCYNTRVITLYTKNGELFTSNFSHNGILKNSYYFRVLSVNDNCCTLLILDYNNGSFTSTKQSVVVNTSCIAAVKCIEDVNIVLL